MAIDTQLIEPDHHLFYRIHKQYIQDYERIPYSRFFPIEDGRSTIWKEIGGTPEECRNLAKGNPLNFGVVEMNVGDIREIASQVTHLDAIHNPIPDSYSHSLVINFPPINHEDFIEVQYGLAKISKWCLFPNPS